MTTTIALAGKGGTGKTTLAALLMRYLTTHHRGSSILAIDADPSSNLHLALGLPNPRSVGEIREEMLALSSSGTVGVGIARRDYLNSEVRMAVEEGDTVDLLAMGRPEGQGCYCSVNHLLRQIVDDLGHGYDYVVMDNEAGMEHLSRRTTENVDWLLMVTDTSQRGIQAAKTMAELARTLAIRVRNVGLVLNRAPAILPEATVAAIAQTGLPLWAQIPDDPLVTEFDGLGRPLAGLPADAPVVRAVERLAAGVLKI
ncbi:MAG: AAA family ATPase [Anaerolineae bacterium]|nr:AAA family ATPase [Anaerolineae bacterium]